MKDAAIIVLLLIILAMAAFDERPSAPALIDNVTAAKVDADFPICVTVKPPPLLRTPKGKADYRMGEPFNDGGTA